MKPLSFKSLKQMLDTLRTEEECRVYLETLRWNGKPVCPHCGSMSEDIASSHETERSKVCISAVTARNVLRCDKE